MPSPGLPLRPSNRGSAKSPTAKPKRLDLGDSQGPYDTNTVREKVRKWQQQGGGVVLAPDVGASDDEGGKSGKDSEASRKKQQRVGRNQTDDDRPKTGDSKEGERTKKAVTSKSRSSGNTPKKRVISDGHWRKDRAPPEPRSQVHTKRTPRGEPKSTKKYEEYKEVFESTEAAKSKSRTDDGIKVYAGPLRGSKDPRDNVRSDVSGRSNSSVDIREKAYRSDTDNVAPRRRSTRRQVRAKYVVNDFPYKSDHSRPHESSDAASFSGTENKASPRFRTPTRTLKSPKNGPRSQGNAKPKTKFSKNDLPPVQQSHGSKVEAWLSRTSDPFIDDDDSLVDIPPPLKSSPRSSNNLADKDVDANEANYRSEEHGKTLRRSPKFLRKSYFGNDEDDRPPERTPTRKYSTENSPTKRKTPRSGKQPGKKEDRKMSMLQESVEEALQATSHLSRPVSPDGSEVSAAERPPPLTLRRMFPSTGAHRLSTIASVDTLDTSTVETIREPVKSSNLRDEVQYDDVSESEIRDQFDPNSLPGPGASSFKRKIATHSDLMSVLSLPAAGSRSIRSARSIRTNRSRLATATVGDILRELSSDEAKYMRELRTLVGGVIPVLLTSVLSKSDSALAAGLFRPGAKNDEANFMRPIVDMGVSLEKLKALHKKIPLDNVDALLTWAQGAQRVYAEYLAAWRLGFQDVVVNLAPPDPDEKGPNSDTQSLYAGMSQDENGDVVDGDGERVDVAFLLKRPLVRLKYLTKTFKGLNYLQSSPRAAEIEKKYQSLVTDARQRANEEKARLEDEAANYIDSSRTRDIHTLSPLNGVGVNQNRRVRARDFFDLSFLHSTGQQIDCRVELLLRDNVADYGPGGDLFICEVDDTGRWLLFAPIDHGRVSARNGDRKGEIIIMVRGVPEEGGNWHELLSLTTEDEQIGFEWVQMLGLSPVPPGINRSLSFVNRAKQKKQPPPIDLKRTESVLSTRSIIPSPTDIGVPVCENEIGVKRVSESRPVNSPSGSRRTTNTASPKPVGASPKPIPYDSPATSTKDAIDRLPRNLNEAMEMAGGTSPTTLKRSKAKRRSKYDPLSPGSPVPPEDARVPEKDVAPNAMLTEPESGSKPGESELLSRSVSPEYKELKATNRTDQNTQRPIAEVTRLGRRSLSPVPSLELPSIPRLRQRSSKSSPPPSSVEPVDVPIPLSPKKRIQKRHGEKNDEPFLRDELNNQPIYTEDVPVPPPHRTPSPSRLKQSSPSVATPTFSPWARHRRTSSPLKHEYEPSTATESTESETSTVERHSIYSSSTTTDEALEDDDIATPLPPIHMQRLNKASPPSSSPSLPDGTIAPSHSASQAPYKTVPPQPSKASKTVASIYYWDEKGSWEALHPQECSIVVTPGLIEAYEMGPAHSQAPAELIGDSAGSDKGFPQGRPFVALELTPLVPIRRGTALDISIRSPPTSNSTLVFQGNNVMFRSRSPDECDRLYGFINQARINNPTYIALQNARGNQPTPLMRYNSTRSNKGSSWFSWYGGSSRNSYRAASAPTPSVAGVTESSVGTMASAFSALKRFGGGSKVFSIARSTLTSRTGSRGGSMYSSGSNSPARQGSGKEQGATKFAMGGIGLTNAKIRLYCRESASKWRDMGAARLTILPASPGATPPATSSNSIHNSGEIEVGADGATTMSPPAMPAPVAPPSRQLEKRIVIHGKAHGQVLLDACLGESCFERVARTGIAVSVWEDFQGIAKEGGVVGRTFKVYMIQMKSEAETAYTFGLVGKLRY